MAAKEAWTMPSPEPWKVLLDRPPTELDGGGGGDVVAAADVEADQAHRSATASLDLVVDDRPQLLLADLHLAIGHLLEPFECPGEGDSSSSTPIFWRASAKPARPECLPRTIWPPSWPTEAASMIS
jgi:hypothetical protein